MQFPFSVDKVQLGQADTPFRNFSKFSLEKTISEISYPLKSMGGLLQGFFHYKSMNITSISTFTPKIIAWFERYMLGYLSK